MMQIKRPAGRWLDVREEVRPNLVQPVLIRATYRIMIVSFRDKPTAAVFLGRLPKGFPSDLVAPARRKLAYLDAATSLDDLRSPPGNRLEALSGDRVGQHSIRVNDQFRLCFTWRDGNAEAVEIVDYH